MKKVIIFSTSYFPYVGGAEVAIKEITDRLESFEFELITARQDPALLKEERIGNVTVHRLGVGGQIDKFLLPVLGVFKIFKIVLEQKVDFFWCMMATFASGPAYIYNILFFWRKVPIVLTLQEGDSEKYIEEKSFGIKGIFWRAMMSPLLIGLPKDIRRQGMIGISWALALRRTSYLTVISKYLADRARYFGFKGRIYFVPNGVDIEKFGISISDNEKAVLKDEIGLRDEERLIMTASRLVEKNAADMVIKSLVFLPNFYKLLIFGDGELRSELKELAESEGVSDKVIFWGKYIHEEMARYLQVTNVFTRPSRSEGQGIVFLEAMAAGVPVVATEVGGIPDFLFPPENEFGKGPTGLFANVDDPKSLAVQIRKLEDPDLSKRLVRNALMMVREDYDWENIAPEMEKVFIR